MQIIGDLTFVVITASSSSSSGHAAVPMSSSQQCSASGVMIPVSYHATVDVGDQFLALSLPLRPQAAK